MSVSFSFGFHWLLSNRETTKVASLLFLIEGFNFRLGRQDVCVKNPNRLEGFSCKSFLRILLDSSPDVKTILDVLWRIKSLKELKFFSLDKFCSIL